VGTGGVDGTATAVAVVAVAAIAACCGSAAVTAFCGSATVAACRVSDAVARSDSVAAIAGCGSETSTAPREPSLAAVAALPADRDALDERLLVGTATSDLNTLAGVRGGTVGATLRMRRREG
jgi:hypothetical protein